MLSGICSRIGIKRSLDFSLPVQAQVEINKLCARLISRVGVRSVRWENIWGHQHYIACLRTFNKLCDMQTERMKNTIAGERIFYISYVEMAICY